MHKRHHNIYFILGLGSLFKFVSLIDIILQQNFGRKKTILKQYLQYLYKVKFLQIFASFGSQRRALEDLITEKH